MSGAGSKDDFKGKATGDTSISSTEDDKEQDATETPTINEPSSSPEDSEQDVKLGERNAESLKNVSPSSMANGSLEGAVGYQRQRSSSSESVVTELNRAAQSLDKWCLESGKLVVFRRYFHEPDMLFFTKPEARKRHRAGNQRRNSEPTDIKNFQERSEGKTEDPLGYVRSYDSPRKPTLNQAGAVIGYPEAMPTAQEIRENKNDIVLCDRPYDTDHSLGSAETVPIHEVYAGNFTPVSHCDGSERISSAGISDFRVSSDAMSSVTSDSLRGAYRISPPGEDSDAKQVKSEARQRKFGRSEPVDIPLRSVRSDLLRPGSCPGYYHNYVFRKSSCELDPHASTVGNSGIVAGRKISQDSSEDFDRKRSLSRESSVDLDMYMTEKPVTNVDEISSLLSQESLSAGSINSPPIPDLTLTYPSSDAQDFYRGIYNVTLALPDRCESFSSESATETVETFIMDTPENEGYDCSHISSIQREKDFGMDSADSAKQKD